MSSTEIGFFACASISVDRLNIADSCEHDVPRCLNLESKTDDLRRGSALFGGIGGLSEFKSDLEALRGRSGALHLD